MSTEEDSNQEQQKEPSFMEVAMSVIAAAFGVQNSRNRERDFSRGNPLVFIAAGIIFTVVFILAIVGVVYLVL